MEDDGMSDSKRVKMSDSEEMTVHPLLIELVVETVFSYCKGSGEYWKALSDYRKVCKVWDKAIVKRIRQDVQVDLSILLAPYPEGLGWKECEEEESGFQYDCPYNMSLFENIHLIGTCDSLSDTKIIRWFEVMGSTVKQLKFTCSLTCYHHTRFLECVLKRWCKNLKVLSLDNVGCIYSLLHNSKFVDFPKLICDLNEVAICVECEDTDPNRSTFQNCKEDLPSDYLNFSDNPYYVIPDDPAFRVFALKILKRMSREFQEPISIHGLEFIRNTTSCDGGVLGQIFATSEVTKFVVKKLLSHHYCQDLLTFLNVRPFKTRETLNHFEFENMPMAYSPLYLDSFRFIKLPLTYLKFGMLFAFRIRNSLRDLIASYANTLEHLEFTGAVMLQDWVTEHDEEFVEIIIPLLPRLKTFINGNIFTCRMGGLEFLQNMPILEKCTLVNTIYHSSIYPLTPTEVFSILFGSEGSFDVPHPLKELTLNGKICYTSHIDLIQTWFPQLVKVELLLDGADVFVDFLRMAKTLDIEDAKVSFYANDNEWCNAGIVNNVGKMNCLKYLQLVHLPDSPLSISAKTCEEGFAKAPRLTSLKLTNFGVFTDEMDSIRKSLSRISCVQFHKLIVQHKPVNVEFSVGCENSFPCHQVAL